MQKVFTVFIKKPFFLVLSLFLFKISLSQNLTINRQQFFLDDRLIETTLTTDIKKLRSDKKASTFQPANIVMHFSDTAIVKEDIIIQTRGVFRKSNCDIASLMLNFKNSTSPKLSALKKLKLVGGCSNSVHDEELLLKEYIIYKIHNIVSNMSFRVRLLHITYSDSKQKVKSYSQYAFLIEDPKDMADRNNCKEVKIKVFPSEGTNRVQMTFVNVFQYMIGNTDWSISNYHNIKLMVPKSDTLARPYVVPYDFDFSGIVDAEYAAPNELFNTTSVKERVYRGAPRTIEEVTEVLSLFKEKKERILFCVNDFSLLSAKTKKTIVAYLEEFFNTIESRNSVRSVFNGKRN